MEERKTLHQLSLEEIISLQETSPEALAAARQASIEFILTELAPLERHAGDGEIQIYHSLTK